MDRINYLLIIYGDGEIYRKAKSILSKELKLAHKPTKKDIRETEVFLHDFGFEDVDIPDVSTYNALCRWRRDYVCKNL